MTRETTSSVLTMMEAEAEAEGAGVVFEAVEFAAVLGAAGMWAALALQRPSAAS